METLRIDVISDVVCPWCYVGKRQLESALVQWSQVHRDEPRPIVAWHAFQLNPEMPAEGVDRADYLLRKFGSADVRGLYERVGAAAESVGLEMDFERIARQPNTLAAHALIAEMPVGSAQDAMVEALFHAYFIEGADLTSGETLLGVAARAGLARDAAQAVLDDRAKLEQSASSDLELRERGVSGVPLFIVDQRFAVHGAQGADAILSALTRTRSPPTAAP